MEILEKLQPIFQDVFDDDDLTVSRETTPQDVDEWDSLQNVNLIVAVENEFSVKFQLDQLHEIVSVGDLVDLVQRTLDESAG